MDKTIVYIATIGGDDKGNNYDSFVACETKEVAQR